MVLTAGLPEGISREYAIAILVVNIFLPGIGTIVSAFLSTDCEVTTVLVGVAQAVTAPIFAIGWLWSIYWSYCLLKKGDEPALPVTQPAAQPVAPEQAPVS